MTLLDANVYDEKRGKARRIKILGVVSLAVVLVVALYLTWNLPAEHRVNQFLAAIESKDFPQAFGIWNNDPGWQDHAQRYATANYPYGRFLNDWGANSDYGSITQHTIVHATSRYGNSTMVVVDINGRKGAPLTLAVQKQTHELTFPPFALNPMPNGLGGTDWQITYR